MTFVLALAIVMASLTVVLWPLFRTRPAVGSESSWERDRLEGLLSRRDSAYGAISDLDFEYRLGNLSEGDYMELRERYRERAARVLQRLDNLTSPSGPAQEVVAQAAEPEAQEPHHSSQDAAREA